MWGMKDVFASRVLQAVSITCNSFTWNAILPFLCSCLSLFIITLISWAEILWQEQHLQESCFSNFKGSLANRCWKGLRENSNYNIWAGNPAPIAVPRIGSAFLAVLTLSFPTSCRKTAEESIPCISSFPFLGFSTCRVRPCQTRCPHMPWWGLPAPGRAVTHPLVGVSPQHVPSSELFSSISCQIPPAPSHDMSASASAAPFPRLQCDKTVNPPLASQQPD